MSPFVLEDLVGPLPVKQEVREAARIPAFLEIGYGYRPGRSFGFSVLAHQLALLLILISSGRFAFVHAAEVVPPDLQSAKMNGPLFLPTLGGGNEGDGLQGGAAGSTAEASTGLRARGHKGFAYPGPQPLVSAPPMAKLGIQTILQPMLKNPPILQKTFALPNLAIAPAPPPPEPAKPVMKVQSGRLAVRPVEKLVRAPKVSLPVAESSAMPDLTTDAGPMPQAPPPKPIPQPARPSDVPVNSRGQQGLLVLNAIPPPPDVIAKVPLGEARSLFAVAPGESTVIADPSAGSRGGGSSTKATGNGTPSDNANGDAIADVPSGGGSGMGSSGSGVGTGAKYGNGTGTGLNSGVEGTGGGRGSAAGTGTGSGAGNALGSGRGAGNAAGAGGFPGISIRGGNYGNGSGGIHPTLTPRNQTSYGMTVTSTASSGGGLPDFGVFQNQKVYTVYLDMRVSDDDTAPSWTLQYAPLQPLSGLAGGAQKQPTPPYATLKQIPELTPELAAICAHKMIVISGILTADGKLEQISVKKSPDPQVNSVVTDALSNWTFQPSQIDGKPVALKIMMGIRLATR
jgi:hypothetical protein